MPFVRHRAPSRMRVAVMAFAAAAQLLGCRRVSAAPAPPPPPDTLARAVKLVTWARGLDEPIGIEFPQGFADVQGYVVEKGGRVRIVQNQGGQSRVDPAPWVDLSDRVSRGSEQGLLGLAFHPGFQDNGRIYLDYTDKNGDSNVIEMRRAPGTQRVDPTSERKLLFVHQPYPNHNGGALVFGPDGKLYVGLGDGGSGFDPHGNGQNPQALLGKMLRIDVDAPAPKPEIVALGLRNPWRYSFDRKTRDLYIADVGQNAFEEIDLVPGGRLTGQNFGWNVREGKHCLTGETCRAYVEPIVEYTHDDGCSITGGFVYRGAALPELDGQYFYADYCTSLMRSLRASGGKVVEQYSWRNVLDPDGKVVRVASFGQDQSGELYLVSQEGTVYKLARR